MHKVDFLLDNKIRFHIWLIKFRTVSDVLVSSLRHTNKGINDALEASLHESVIFVAPQIDILLKCFIVMNKEIMISPSNPILRNYYNSTPESAIEIQLKLKPK